MPVGLTSRNGGTSLVVPLGGIVRNETDEVELDPFLHQSGVNHRRTEGVIDCCRVRRGLHPCTLPASRHQANAEQLSSALLTPSGSPSRAAPLNRT